MPRNIEVKKRYMSNILRILNEFYNSVGKRDSDLIEKVWLNFIVLIGKIFLSKF